MITRKQITTALRSMSDEPKSIRELAARALSIELTRKFADKEGEAVGVHPFDVWGDWILVQWVFEKVGDGVILPERSQGEKRDCVRSQPWMRSYLRKSHFTSEFLTPEELARIIEEDSGK